MAGLLPFKEKKEDYFHCNISFSPTLDVKGGACSWIPSPARRSLSRIPNADEGGEGEEEDATVNPETAAVGDTEAEEELPLLLLDAAEDLLSLHFITSLTRWIKSSSSVVEELRGLLPFLPPLPRVTLDWTELLLLLLPMARWCSGVSSTWHRCWLRLRAGEQG